MRAEAGRLGYIGTQHPGTKRWSNIPMLYRAKERLMVLGDSRAGKKIEEADMKSANDRYPRICWRLIDKNAMF